MDIVTELEHYLGGHELDTFVRTMMVECLKEKPDEPKSWMLGYMLDQNANSANIAAPAAVGTSSSEKGPEMHAAVLHKEAETQKYLIEKKVHLVFLELLKKVAQEKPDNVLSFVALEAHNMHKNPPPGLG